VKSSVIFLDGAEDDRQAGLARVISPQRLVYLAEKSIQLAVVGGATGRVANGALVSSFCKRFLNAPGDISQLDGLELVLIALEDANIPLREAENFKSASELMSADERLEMKAIGNLNKF
jgi:hypothetical protein